jgi:hypothetical protein
VTLNNSRYASVQNGGNITNRLFVEYLALMMSIEYGTFDTQKISSGFSGLLPSSNKYPEVLRNTGRTAGLGNGTGEILADDSGVDSDLLTMNNGASQWESDVRHVVQFSYRGIEDPFGVQFTYCDGILASRTGYWYTNATELYSALSSNSIQGGDGLFPSAGYTGSEYVWINHTFPTGAGYINLFTDNFIPLSLTGSSNTSLCDYFYWTDGGNKYIIYTGGDTDSGTSGGMFGWYMKRDAVDDNIGSRLMA